MIRQYEAFDIKAVAERGRNYVTRMTDERLNYLPYWFVQVNQNPAFAKHVRVDDAELVASWYEAIVALRHILGPDELATKVEEGFKAHILSSWGPQGLRYHEDYPWTHTIHSSFHEMGYILSALNRMLDEEPKNVEAERRAAQLVRGLRSLVIERKTQTFWSGDYPFPEKIYEFPLDVYLPKEGWVSERATGRGEEAIRNAVMLKALVVRAEKHEDPVALDLAEGIANHLLGISRHFNYKGEYFGHVHSAVWFASGLVRLGRLVDRVRYIDKGRQILDYTLSISSSFGWVPEYAQWHPPGEEFCETCCIKDTIECAFELIDAGYDYWDIIERFARNQLAEQQIKDGSFVQVDNSLPDTEDMTFAHLDERVVGGWSGGGEVNSISLSRFRSVAGCCVGTAPQALQFVFDRVVEERPQGVFVNFAIDRSHEAADVAMGYPNQGFIRVTAKRSGPYFIRLHGYMVGPISLLVNGSPVPLTFADGCAVFSDVEAGDQIELAHALETIERTETVRDARYHVKWRGPDVVEIDPPGLPLRMYEREVGKETSASNPADAGAASISMKPTEQKG